MRAGPLCPYGVESPSRDASRAPLVAPDLRRVSDTLVWVAGITQAITAVVALAALGVSIYSLYLQRRDKSPGLRVRGVLVPSWTTT